MPIDPEIDKAYNPSVWSNRYSESYDEFLDLSKKAVEKARSSIPCKIDIAYGPTERMKFDIYGINLPNDAPVLVFIHGGYWRECNKESAGFHISPFVSKGIKVINVGYDLCPAVTLTDIVNEIRSAIETILKYCKKTGTKSIWISGHSAGAHLAASILYDREWHTSMKHQQLFQLIKGLILLGGIYSLEPLVKTSVNEDLKLTEQEIKTISYNTLDMSKTEPINGIKVLVVVGESDAPTFINESRNYAKKLMDFVDQVEFILLREKIDHFEIVEKFSDPSFSLFKIIMSIMNYES
ncbi:kynurenine formamidase [Chelonus insularis]|uniref:kynurenine formamidase n=1 Tax=Chelonus insularis TaxID=460826 RepID=UPI0015887A17|nr:kynurenine formamidase [Chelonus insularis]